MPQTMRWGPIYIVAQVWCCSEHYLWLFDSDFLLETYTAMYCHHAVIEVKLAVCKLLEGGSYSVSRCVRPWINLILEYPFKARLQHPHL